MVLDPTSYIVAGYASVFGNIDDDEEIVDAGAFAESIAAKQAVKFYYQHEGIPMLGNRPPRGQTYLLREDDFGLYFESNLVATPASAELATLMGAGILTDASFHYGDHVKKYDAAGRVHLAKMDILEVSVTAQGSNPLAKAWLQEVAAVKSDIRGVFLAEFQRFTTELKIGDRHA